MSETASCQRILPRWTDLPHGPSFIEPIVERHEASYDHDAFTKINSETWQHISIDIDAQRHRVSAAKTMPELAGFAHVYVQSSRIEFADAFQANRITLASMLAELSAWLVSQSSRNKCITVLGL